MISDTLTPPLALAAQAGKLQETVIRAPSFPKYQVGRRPILHLDDRFSPIELLPFRVSNYMYTLGDPIVSRKVGEGCLFVSCQLVKKPNGSSWRLAGCRFNKQSALTRTVSRTRARAHTLKCSVHSTTLLPPAPSKPCRVEIPSIYGSMCARCCEILLASCSQDFSFPLR
jgi:hypothetical protein